MQTMLSIYTFERLNIEVWKGIEALNMSNSNDDVDGLAVLMMTSSYENIPRGKASDAELWCFLWSSPEDTVVYTIEAPVIWDDIAFIMTSL